MTNKEILNGLDFRLKGLRDAVECLTNANQCSNIVEDMEARIDEIESIYHWVYQNSGSKKVKK